MRVAANDNFPHRLLTKSQAAQYCGLSVATFGGICPVKPIALGDGVRMHRYDVRDIDRWIDGFKAGGAAPRSKFEELMEKL
ncbi:helix-turn-helix transcriptional regulator [Sinorhizobium medicae]